ncbi:MAG: hypothetical protein SEPTF4163_005246, partial [Sporothrix epigloea]
MSTPLEAIAAPYNLATDMAIDVIEISSDDGLEEVFINPEVEAEIYVDEKLQGMSDASLTRRPADIPPSHRLLTGPPYDSAAQLLLDLNDWAKSNGLGFMKIRTNNIVDG